jgi:hypothetical protein
MIVTEGKRSLGLQRITGPSSASSTGRKTARGLEASIVALRKYEDLICGCVVCHCIYALWCLSTTSTQRPVLSGGGYGGCITFELGRLVMWKPEGAPST